jgi:hypothetical protein
MKNDRLISRTSLIVFDCSIHIELAGSSPAQTSPLFEQNATIAWRTGEDRKKDDLRIEGDRLVWQNRS